ncbi:MAG: hypothetical protein LBT59_12080 [Clostridiales bacterium]|nr:hypothetical protein [Clostridiales bacterium]
MKTKKFDVQNMVFILLMAVAVAWNSSVSNWDSMPAKIFGIVLTLACLAIAIFRIAKLSKESKASNS